jgi:linoleoyl-CoA desaturase
MHLAQPLLSPLSGLFFEYMIGAFDIGLLDYLRPGRRMKTAKTWPAREFARELWAFVKKAARLSFVDYVVYPALAGPLAPKVVAGNALANAVRNVWGYVVIYCGHLTEGTATFREEDLEGEDRAHCYARQVMGSGNFETSPLGHVLSGHLGFQIEHHLFPNIPCLALSGDGPSGAGDLRTARFRVPHGLLAFAVRERHAPARTVRSSRQALSSRGGARLWSASGSPESRSRVIVRSSR